MRMADRLREHEAITDICPKCLKSHRTYSLDAHHDRKDRQNAYKNYVDKTGVEQRNLVLDIV